jgi:general secretion pathway protein L
MEGTVAPEKVPVALQAYALAQRTQMGGRSARFNLRRNDLAFKGDFQYLKGKVGRLGAFAAILLAVAGANSYARISKLSAREKLLDDKLCEMTQKVLSKCQSDFTVALALLREHNAPSAGIPQVSAVELLAETTNRIPDEASAKISEVEITENRIRLRGTVDSFDSVEKLTTNLKAYRCFTAVNRGKTEKDQNDKDRIVFSLDIEVGCQGSGNQG